MKPVKFTKQDFQSLSQLDRIEYEIRRERVVQNIRKSIPNFEILSIIFIYFYSRLYSLNILSALGITDIALQSIQFLNKTFLAFITVLAISAICRLAVYYRKHQQMYELNQEFLDKALLNVSLLDDATPIKLPRRKKVGSL